MQGEHTGKLLGASASGSNRDGATRAIRNTVQQKTVSHVDEAQRRVAYIVVVQTPAAFGEPQGT